MPQWCGARARRVYVRTVLRARTLGIGLVLVGSVLSGACQEAPGTLIAAASGGRVTSSDGVFTLVIPPGALREDARIHIDELPEESWPVSTPERFRLIAPVYAIEPAGLALLGDVYGVHVLDTAPEALRTAEGDPILAVHFVYSADAIVAPAPATRTIYLADGRVAVIATLHELGTMHWAGDKTPRPDRSLLTLSARIDAEAGEHAAGETWRAAVAELRADGPLVLVDRVVHSAVAHGPGMPTVAPAADDGFELRTWNATWDPELGLHPWEVFDVSPGERTEIVASIHDVAPITIDTDLPLSPISTPLPGWRCGAASTDGASAWLGVDVVSGASSGTVRVGIAREIGGASCR